MVLVCAPGHRLSRISRLALEDLAGEKVIGFDSDLTIRREIDRVLQLRDHHHAVRGEGDVEFQRIDAQRDGALEGGQRVFRRQPARAAVALEVESEGGSAAERGGKHGRLEGGNGLHGGDCAARRRFLGLAASPAATTGTA